MRSGWIALVVGAGLVTAACQPASAVGQLVRSRRRDRATSDARRHRVTRGSLPWPVQDGCCPLPDRPGILAPMSCEVSWFSALCDDDYEFLGVPDRRLQSSWEHCRDIALGRGAGGFDNLLLPSGYAMGIDTIAFAAGIAPLLRRMRLLVAVRMGEMWPPQLARQLATIDQMLGGRLTINIISSDLPGETLESAPRYRRTLEVMRILRDLLTASRVDFHGEFIEPQAGPAAAAPGPGRLPAVLLRRPVRGGPRGRRQGRRRVPDVARHDAGVGAVIADMPARAARYGRTLRFGYRAHVIVRATEAEARAAAGAWSPGWMTPPATAIRRRSLDTSSRGNPAAGRAARHRRRRRLRRGEPVDRHRPRALRRGRRHRRRSRSGAGQDPRLRGPRHGGLHPVRLPARRRSRPVRPPRAAPPRPWPAAPALNPGPRPHPGQQPRPGPAAASRLPRRWACWASSHRCAPG